MPDAGEGVLPRGFPDGEGLSSLGIHREWHARCRPRPPNHLTPYASINAKRPARANTPAGLALRTFLFVNPLCRTTSATTLPPVGMGRSVAGGRPLGAVAAHAQEYRQESPCGRWSGG